MPRLTGATTIHDLVQVGGDQNTNVLADVMIIDAIIVSVGQVFVFLPSINWV